MIKKKATHKELMSRQANHLEHGEVLLAKGRELLAEGNKLLRG